MQGVPHRGQHGVPPGAVAANASSTSRLPELLDWIRQEFEGFVNDAHSLRAQVSDYDAHCAWAIRVGAQWHEQLLMRGPYPHQPSNTAPRCRLSV